MKMSKKLAMVAMVSGFGLTAAHAADIPNHKQAPTPVAPMAAQAPEEFSWTGFHLGVNAGGVKMHTPEKSFKGVKYPMAAIGGIQGGYDHQFGQFVLGLEGDANFSSGPVIKEGAFKSSVNQMFTVRGRAGYAVDRALIYATGGYANMSLKLNKAAKAGLTADELKAAKESRSGWTVGGGLEYALTDNLSARGEYLYVNMPKQKKTDVDGDRYTVPKATFSVVRAGLNYKF